jgi:hypothetical protein
VHTGNVGYYKITKSGKYNVPQAVDERFGTANISLQEVDELYEKSGTVVNHVVKHKVQ